MPKKETHKNLILAIIALAQFMVVLDVSIINVALPSIYRALHFGSTGSLQWIVTAYTLTFGGFLLLGGRAADLYGRKRLFIIGTTVFAAVSLLCGLSQNSNMLIILRAIQGLAAAFMSPAALSIIITTFKEGKERDRALGVWGAVAAGGAAFGVLLGGILTQYLNWRWNFFINVPVGIIVAFSAWKLIPESKAELKHRHLDLPGAILVTSGLMLLVYGLVKAPSYGWNSARTIEFLVISAMLLVAFVINEKRSKQPLVPLSIFSIRNVTAANLTQLPIAASLFSMFFFLSLYVQQVLGYSPVKSGLSFLPVTIIIGITATVSSRLVTRFGYKPFMITGTILMAIGLYMLSGVSAHGTYWADVFPGLSIMAFGLGMIFVSATIAATNGVPAHESGLASGLFNTSQQIGGALGLAILSGEATSRTIEVLKTLPATADKLLIAQTAGYQRAFMVGVTFAIAALILTIFLIKQPKGEKIDPKAAMMAG